MSAATIRSITITPTGPVPPGTKVKLAIDAYDPDERQVSAKITLSQGGEVVDEAVAQVSVVDVPFDYQVTIEDPSGVASVTQDAVDPSVWWIDIPDGAELVASDSPDRHDSASLDGTVIS